MNVHLNLHKPRPEFAIGAEVSMVISDDDGKGSLRDGRIVAIDREGDRPTAIEVKAHGSGAIYRVLIPPEVAALPAGSRHIAVMQVEVCIMDHPEGGKGILLQLPDGFTIMRPKGAREVGQALLDAAKDAALGE